MVRESYTFSLNSPAAFQGDAEGFLY